MILTHSTYETNLINGYCCFRSGQQHTSHVNSSQSHPKKRSGFVITSVKDNVDGDESADDLDESHASYSDISYSRATDIDHDQESSASDETLNVTAADGTTTQNNLAQNKLPVKQTATLKDQQTADPSPQVLLSSYLVEFITIFGISVSLYSLYKFVRQII